MKAAYRDSGYDVALTEDGLLIQTSCWGVEILAEAVPNSIKSLIVLHNGAMPRMNSAVHLQKDSGGDMILEVVLASMDDLSSRFIANEGRKIKPTRVTLDGYRVWQVTKELDVKLVHVDNQQIFSVIQQDGYLVNNAIYARNWFGQMYMRTEIAVPEDKPLLQHLAQMQWIPVELG